MKFILILLLLLLVMCTNNVFAKSKPKETPPIPVSIPEYTGPKIRLGVMDLEVKTTIKTETTKTSEGSKIETEIDKDSVPEKFGEGLTSMLITALINSKRFVVLERKAMDDITKEQGIVAAGDSATTTTPNSLIGAQTLIRGAVTEYSNKYSTIGGSMSIIPGINIGHTQATAAVVLDVRIYDVKTGQIIDSVRAEGKASSSKTGVGYDNKKNGVSTSFDGSVQTPLGEASRQAINNAVIQIIARMEKVVWEGAIADIETADTDPKVTLYLNAGSDLGLKEGDVLEVLRAGTPIKDPQTKTIIGRKRDTRIGTCKIIEIKPSLAIAVPIEGTDFQKEDILHFPETPKPTPEATAALPTTGAVVNTPQ
jgi:curli biogenesis system outer membrane secretion channel CsgG